MHFYRNCWFYLFKEQFISHLNFGQNYFETGFVSDCPSLMLGIAIRCIQHFQAMLERGVCELAHSFFHLGYVISFTYKVPLGKGNSCLCKRKMIFITRLWIYMDVIWKYPPKLWTFFKLIWFKLSLSEKGGRGSEKPYTKG